ncbi:FUSC family membrane protein [soil metagenome]
MEFSTTLKRLLFSQHILSGLQAAFGVIGIGVFAFQWFGVVGAATLGSGALVVSITDTPSPILYKLREIIAAAIASTLITLLAAAAQVWLPTLVATVLLSAFMTAMVSAYGKRAMPLGFCLTFSIVLGLAAPPSVSGDALHHATLFGLGSAFYAAYALLIGWLLRYRYKRQALAETIYELAQYLRISANFYEPGTDTDHQYQRLVDQLGTLIDKQQSARDFLFWPLKNQRDARLAAIFISILDVYETALSMQADYAGLQARFDGTDAILFVRDLIRKAAQDLEQISYRVMRNRAVFTTVSYKAELFAFRHDYGRMLADAAATRSPEDPLHEALATLNAAFDRLRHTLDAIAEVHTIARREVKLSDLPVGPEIKSFMTPTTYSLRLLKAQLTFRSPTLRYALRLSSAMGCGLAVTHLLMTGIHHSYWVLLTIAVIMRANYAQTRQRRLDRIFGTIAGCIVAAVLLHFYGSTTWLLVTIMFFAIAIAHAFALVTFRYTAIAASIMALLNLHLLDPSGTFVIAERVIDTAIGAFIAWLFSFVLPSCEYRDIPRQVTALLKVEAAYARAVLSHSLDDLPYRVARKALLDQVTQLAASAKRMLAEPQNRHRAARELNAFITLNYLFGAHIAALQVLMKRRGADIQWNKVERALELTKARIEQVLNRTAPPKAAAAGAAAPDMLPEAEGDILLSNTDQDPTALLIRRLKIVRQEAVEIERRAHAVIAEMAAPNRQRPFSLHKAHAPSAPGSV